MATRRRRSRRIGPEEQQQQAQGTRTASTAPARSPDAALPGLLQRAATQPGRMTPRSVQALQRTYGNRAVRGLLPRPPVSISRLRVSPGTVQTKRKWKGLFKENVFKYWAKVKKYNLCLGKGTRIWERVQNKIKKFTDTVSEDTPSTSNKHRGTLESDYTTKVDRSDESRYHYKVTTIPKDLGTPEQYINYINLTTGKIKAHVNVRKTSEGKKPTYSKIPNSDVLWYQYGKAKEKNQTARFQKPMGDIKQISRTSIMNQDTLDVMDIALETSETSKTFTQDNEEFLALLGTPNGKSSLWILHDHMSPDWLKTVDTVKATLLRGEQSLGNADAPSLDIRYKDVT